jgi:hypothetical protein
VPNGRLVLQPVARTVEWEGVRLSDPIALRVYHGVVIGLDVALDGQPYQAMLDLGTESMIVSSPVGVGLGIDDDGSATMAVGETMRLPIEVQVRDLPFMERFDPDGKGFVLVGAPIAYDCAVSISWIHREMRVCVQ